MSSKVRSILNNPTISPSLTSQYMRSRTPNQGYTHVQYSKEESLDEGESDYENELIEKVLKMNKDKFNQSLEKKKINAIQRLLSLSLLNPRGSIAAGNLFVFKTLRSLLK